MKKILSLALSFALALALFVPRTAVFAEGTYNEHTKTLHFKDEDTKDTNAATTRVEYQIVQMTFKDKKIPVVKYTFTYNPEFATFSQRPLIGFVLPEAVGVPLRIHKEKAWKNGAVYSKEEKIYKDDQVIQQWLNNDSSQDYGSARRKVNLGSVPKYYVVNEAYGNNAKHKQIYNLNDHKNQITKAYENYHFTTNKDAEGKNQLDAFLEGKASQIFASWEPFDNSNRYIFTVIAPFRNPQNLDEIITDSNKLNEDALKNSELTALAYISSKNATTAKTYRIAGVKATVDEVRNAKDGKIDSNRTTLSEVRKLTLTNEDPVKTKQNEKFKEEEVKKKVVAPTDGSISEVQDVDVSTPGAKEITVTVKYNDGSTDTIKVPGIVTPLTTEEKEKEKFLTEHYNPIKEKFENQFEKLQIDDKTKLEAAKKAYDALSEETKRQLIEEIKKIHEALAKIAEWEDNVKEFKNKYKEYYEKPGVDIDDEVKIQEALEEYETLDPKVKAKLTEEKKKLDDKKALIDAAKAKADEFNKKYNDVTDETSPKLQDALKEYKDLSDLEKEALKKKYPNLVKVLEDAVNKKNDTTDQDTATKFKEDNKDLLAKDPATVTIEDEAKIEKLEEDYDSLSNGVKNALGDEVKDKIDALVEKLKELKKTKYEFIKDQDNQDKIKVKVTKYVKDKNTGKGKLEETIRDIELKDADNSIIIVQEPTKKAYKVGEKFDPAGLKIKLVDKEAGESEEITHDKFEANNISLKLEGDKEITTALAKADTKVIVKYGNKQAEVNITVTEEGVGKPSEPAPAPAPSPAPAPQPKPNVPAPSVPAPSKPSTPIAPKEDNNIFRSERKDKEENQKQNAKDKVPNTGATQTAGVMLTISLAAACLLNKKRK